MTEVPKHEITELLQAWRQGDEHALEKLTPQLYRELHRAARGCMARERGGHTLQTTALINELYLRLFDLKLIDWQNRAHFFALCARQMRRILTDQARARQSHKRGGGAQEPGGRDALLWRTERGGNSGGAQGFTGNGDAGLEVGQGLAAARPERRKIRWSVSAGGKSNKSFTRLRKWYRAAEASSSSSRVREMRTSAARWSRCWTIIMKPGASSRRPPLLTRTRPQNRPTPFHLRIQTP